MWVDRVVTKAMATNLKIQGEKRQEPQRGFLSVSEFNNLMVGKP